MTMKKVEIDIPEEIVQYTVLADPDAQMKRNAMVLYPFVQNGTISHGKAAEMLGMYKMDLITLYGSMGLPYFNQSREELEEDMLALKKVRGTAIC